MRLPPTEALAVWRGRPRALPSSLVSIRRLLLVLACVAALSACADATSSAIDVNGSTFSRTEVNDFLRDIGEEIDEDVEGREIIGSGPGTMQQDVVSSVLNVWITNEIFRQDLERQGTDISDEDVAAAASTTQVTGYATFDTLFTEFVARQQLIDPTMAQELILGAEVSIDPRWGRWVNGQVVPNYVDVPEAP